MSADIKYRAKGRQGRGLTSRTTLIKEREH
jgi:hypothetical protein